MGAIQAFCDTAAQTPSGEWHLQAGGVTFVSVCNNEGGSAVTDFDTPLECPPGTVVSQSSFAGTYELECSNFAGTGVELDGVPTNINNLPVGFHITSLRVQAAFSIINTTNGADFITMMQILYDLGVVFDNPNLADGSHVINANIDLLGVSYLTLYGAHWEFRFTFIDNIFPNFGCGPQPACFASVGLSRLFIDGQFELVSWTFPLDPGPYSVGENVDITAADNLDDLSEIYLTFDGTEVIVNTFVVQTATLLTFTLPIGLGNFTGTVNVSGKGNGVQFSGFVMLGTLEILLANASGIYTLVKNKTNDTIYDRSTPGATIDVKIPNPFIKTGFIGG